MPRWGAFTGEKDGQVEITESLAGVTEEYSPTQGTAPKSRSHGQHAGGVRSIPLAALELIEV